MSFKKDFVWGAATASYQIEGAAYEDGKGLNIWDDYCKIPGKILNGDNGDIACDHYHRYKEDVALMKQLGIKAYRFSVSWARILPNGIGKVNPKGLEFYKNLVDELKSNGITPYVTLFHWDYPSKLFEKGGWLNPESPEWFAEYVRTFVGYFKDSIPNYIIFNEPSVTMGCGYLEACHAPGIKLHNSMVVPMSHNMLKAHGMAVKVIRELAPNAKIGYAPASNPIIPFNNDEKEVEAARKKYFCNFGEGGWVWSASWWGDPIVFGKYPEEGLKVLEKYLPQNYKDDMPLINQPIDFYGHNIYQGEYVKEQNGVAVGLPRKVGYPRTAIEWPITPEALYWGPKFLYERYNLPIIITENGLSCHDVISLDGKVHDPNRIDFLNRYLLQLKKAAEDGVDIAGYFQWSLMDNFEWARGYFDRFGLIYVDYETQKRIPKDSFYWYSEVIKQNGENL